MSEHTTCFPGFACHKTHHPDHATHDQYHLMSQPSAIWCRDCQEQFLPQA